MQWIIALIILAAIVLLIIYGLIRDKKQGKSTCGHGCSSCAMHGQCHQNKK